MATKIKYTKSVYGATRKAQLKKEILGSLESSPELRKEIARVFQMANRRIQNIESKGLISPSVMALNKGDIKRYSKFSMRGSWTDLKIEYGKAIAFLRQPTSTAQGTRQYNTHLQKTYDLTPDEFNLMAKSLNDKLMSLSDSNFVERYLMRYKDFTGELEQSAKDVSTQIESEAHSIERALNMKIENAANEIASVIDNSASNIANTLNEVDEGIDKVLKGLSKFGL